MIKKDEVRLPDSCLNKALDGEMVFVLRAKDPVAPHAIREWVRGRIDNGMNTPDDPKIKEALLSATIMDQQRAGGMFAAPPEDDKRGTFGPGEA